MTISSETRSGTRKSWPATLVDRLRLTGVSERIRFIENLRKFGPLHSAIENGNFNTVLARMWDPTINVEKLTVKLPRFVLKDGVWGPVELEMLLPDISKHLESHEEVAKTGSLEIALEEYPNSFAALYKHTLEE